MQGAVQPDAVLNYCATLLRRASLTALQLAVHMGEAKPDKAEQRREPSPRQSEAIEMASRPDGASTSEIAEAMGVSYGAAYTHLRRLQDAGRVTCASYSGAERGKIARWFADHSAAKSWRDTQIAERDRAKRQQAKARRIGKPGAQLVAPQRGTLKPEAADTPGPASAVIVPDNVKRTVQAAPRGRFELEPGVTLTGGFSTTRPGINPLTGEAW